MVTDEDIKRTLLRKMLRLEYIGRRHTSIENLPKGFPKNERGRVMKIAWGMLKDGYFIRKSKPDSVHVSLDPRILGSIRQEIESEDRNSGR